MAASISGKIVGACVLALFFLAPALAACSVSILSPMAGTYNWSSIGVNYTYADAGWVGYSLDGGDNNTLGGNITLSVADGDHSLALYATQDNCTASASVGFSVDTAAPGAPALNVGAATSLNPYNVSGAAEPGSSVTIMVNGTPQVSASCGSGGTFWKLVYLQEGANSISAFATDPAGNRGPASGAYPITLDSRASLNFTVPEYSGESGIAVSGTAEPGAVVRICVNGTEKASGTSDGSFSLTIQLDAGDNEITVNVTDQAGNSNASTAYCFYDPNRPRIGAFYPLDGGVIAERELMLSATCTDSGSGVNASSAYLLLDGAGIDANFSDGVISAYVEVGDGAHTAKAGCSDLAGNIETATWSFNADASVPAAPGNLYISGMNGSALLSWSIVADAVSYRIYRSETPDALMASDPVSSTISNYYSDTPNATGNYYYTVRAVDIAGNLGEAATPVLFVKVSSGTGPPPAIEPVFAEQSTLVSFGGTTLNFTRMLGSDEMGTTISIKWRNVGYSGLSNVEISENVPASVGISGASFSPEPHSRTAATGRIAWRTGSLEPGTGFSATYSYGRRIESLEGFTEGIRNYEPEKTPANGTIGQGTGAGPEKPQYGREIDVSGIWVDMSKPIDFSVVVLALMLVAGSGLALFGALYFLLLRGMEPPTEEM